MSSGCFKGDSWVFQGSFKGVSIKLRGFQECLKVVPRLFQGVCFMRCFKGVSRVCEG